MADTFNRRIDELARSVGTGHIVAGCTVNQPYAQNQHQSAWFKHNDGRAFYLGGPLMEHAFELVAGVARDAITESGSAIDRKMIDVAEWMARAVLENAPQEDTEVSELANSGHPWVKSNGILIYDRPPLAPRERK